MIKGISQLYSREGTPPGYAFFAKNMQSTKLDEIRNEKGTLSIPSFPGSSIVGSSVFGNLLIICYIQAGLDRIGIYDETAGVFTEKLARTDLGFALANPISIKAKYNFKQELIVVLNDRKTTPKYINLDTASGSDLLESYSLNFFASQANIKATPVDSSGAFQSGAYIIATQFVDKNDMSTQWSTLSNVVYVPVHSLTATSTGAFGSESGRITSKGIKLTLSNLSTNYSKLRIALISKINDVVTAKVYKELNIQSSSMVTVVTGTELTTPVNLEEILTPGQFFSSADNIESLADQLFVGGFNIPNIGDFTAYTNALSLQWTSTPKYQALQAANTISLDQTGQKGFAHDEVYAFYARYELLDNTVTQWFHIPGKAFPSSPDLRAPSTRSAGAGNIDTGGSTIKVFQLEDTCSYTGVVGSISSPNAGYAYGEFSYWENENETYPTGHPYAGEKVRHWRFPSTRWLGGFVYDPTVGSTQQHNYLTTMWDTLGVRVVVPVAPPGTPPFKRLQIGYAKRDEANTTVLGYDIVQVGGAPITSPSIESSTGGNWEIQAPGSSPENDFIVLPRVLRMHSPDIFITRPSVNDLYISYIKRMRLDGVGGTNYQHGTFGRVSSGEAGGDVVDVWSFVSNFRYAQSSAIIGIGSSYKKLINPLYLPNNTSTTLGTTSINNLLNEEVLRAEVNADVSIAFADQPSTEYKVNVGGNAYNVDMFEETILMSIKVPRSDMYISYIDQTIVPCGDFINTVLTHLVGEGDTFICTYSFLTMCSAPGLNGPFNFESADGCRNFKTFLCESRFNLNERTITEGDPNTYHLFDPRIAQSVDRSALWVLKLDQNNFPGNQIIYSKDFNTLNVYEAYGVYDHNIDYRSEYPYAIARSVKSSRASSIDDGWRTFLPNDVFYTSNNKGRITNLQAIGTDNLLIHHEYALFKTRDKAVLQSDIAKISLGSGDLFALEPEELLGTDYGFGGTKHKYSCLLSEHGYSFADAATGEILLYKDGKTFANIGKGLYNFFRDTLRNITINDNPLNSSGITTAFDKLNNRLVLSLKAGLSYTFYFDFTKDEWFSGCDALPDLLINTRRNLYSFKTGAMYVHNKGERGNYYATIYPSYVDVIVNDSPTLTKVLQSIEWLSRVQDDSGLVFNNETLDSITIWNNTFCTGKIDIKIHEILSNYEANTEKTEDGNWRFNTIKDAVKDLNLPFISDYTTDYRPISTNLATERAWYNSAPIRGQYFIIRLEYSNLSNKELSLKAVRGNMAKSHS